MLAKKAPRREILVIEDILCVGIVKVTLPGAIDAECAKGREGLSFLFPPELHAKI